MKCVMVKPGTANINGHQFSWAEGDTITLSVYEKSVLSRGGYVGEEVQPEMEKEKPKAKPRAKKSV